ncbi:unnamed protein product, partial [marine sediment metagenome]
NSFIISDEMKVQSRDANFSIDNTPETESNTFFAISAESSARPTTIE